MQQKEEQFKKKQEQLNEEIQQKQEQLEEKEEQLYETPTVYEDEEPSYYYIELLLPLILFAYLDIDYKKPKEAIEKFFGLNVNDNKILIIIIITCICFALISFIAFFIFVFLKILFSNFKIKKILHPKYLFGAFYYGCPPTVISAIIVISLFLKGMFKVLS